MQRVTIEIPDDLDEALTAYGRSRALGDDPNAVVVAALRELLESRAYLIPDRPFVPFHITPFHRSDGPTDVSLNHDRYFAEAEDDGPPQ